MKTYAVKQAHKALADWINLIGFQGARDAHPLKLALKALEVFIAEREEKEKDNEDTSSD